MNIPRIAGAVVAAFGLLAIVTACGSGTPVATGVPVTVTAPSQSSQQSTVHGGTTTPNSSTPDSSTPTFPYPVTQGTASKEIQLAALIRTTPGPSTNGMTPPAPGDATWPDAQGTKTVTYVVCNHDIKSRPEDYALPRRQYVCNIAFADAPPQSYWADLAESTPLSAGGNVVDAFEVTVRNKY